ncbi:hypothetical protein DPEC_G00322830 [Dallia pectoralis]|uniref:Uncharacterized protein n=1 Tax=Dallia pectoralis TaxID=75939 RepID=A0ACC2FAN6_DALPE|nr:hypothetical protein DPEC_G00322830 [Dallia pectoralis]
MDCQIKQRVFTGVVTQLQEHYGIVDQEVRFQKSVVKGRVPAVGERVLVKAVLDLSHSHNWNAQRVQSLAEHTPTSMCPPPLLPSMMPPHGPKPSIMGNKPQPLLKSPKIPPLIPSILHTVAKPGLLQTPSWGCQFESWGRGTRKRPDGARRGDRREDSGVRSSDLKRRRWEEEKEAQPKKISSTPPQSPALFSCFSRDCASCDSLELQRRYPHLSLPPSVCHLSVSWIDSFPLSQPLCFPLPQPCLYHIGSAQPEAEQHTHTEREDGAYTVKVLLLSMTSAEDLYRQCCGLQDQTEPQEGVVHPATLIKFLLGQVGGEYRVLGGPWSSEKDGGGLSPLKDPQALMRTALRCVKEQTELDLSACSHWYKMAELSYVCEGKVETVVFLMPDVWRIVPTEEDWNTLRTEEEAPTLPASPCLVVKPLPGLTLCPVSLSSLLEHPTSATKEAFEVGLLAELFCEMLQRDFGLLLYQCLCSLEPTHKPLEDDKTKNDNKRREKDDRRSKRFQERGEARGRSAEDREDETDDDGEEMDGKQTKVEIEPERENLDKQAVPCEISDCLLKHNVLSRRVLLACVFFDRQLTGSLRKADLRNIFLSLGLWLTPTQVQVLLNKVCVEGLCQYRKLALHWEETEHAEPDNSMEVK